MGAGVILKLINADCMVKMKYSKALKRADKYFSLYIRARDSINGIGTCITCGRKKEWEYMDNGHYIKRQHITTRFDEQNCNIQCKHCNCFEQGANEKYKIAIDLKYGKGTADKLEMKKRMRGGYDVSDLIFLANEYRLRLKELKNE